MFSAFALGSFVYALLVLARPGAMDAEADSDSPEWSLVAKGGVAFALALVFTVIAVSWIDV